MLRGILVGSMAGLALSAVLLGSASLVVPPPALDVSEVMDVSKRVPTDVVAPVQTQAPMPGPDALPQREAPPARRPDTASATVPADRIAIPAGSQFGRPEEGAAIVTPVPDASPRRSANTAPGAQAAPPGSPLADTQSTAVPEPAAVTALSSPPADGTAPDRPAASAEAAPRTFREVRLAREEILADGEGQTVPLDRATADLGRSTPNADTPSGTEIAADGAPSALTVTPAIRALSPDEVLIPEPSSRRRPDPVATAPTIPNADPDETPAILPTRLLMDRERGAEITPDETDGRAVETFSAPVERRPGVPILAIVLVEDRGGGLSRDALTGLELPVAFAIDATDPNAGDAMRVYRDAGHEVLILGDALAPDGSPQDIEVAFAGARAAVPEAVGVLDRPGQGFADRPLALAALLPSLEETGLGLVTYPRGLGSGITTARREGVPSAQLYRILDAEGQAAPAIERVLDRATFQAALDGTVLVVGRTTPETVAGLAAWTDGERAETVDVVPVSEVLRQTVN